MQQRVYDEAVALSLMKVANPWHAELISAIEMAVTPEQKGAAIVEASTQLTFILKSDGLYRSETLCSHCPEEEIFDWSPAYDMDWPDAPNPATAPMLPLPFTANELAAFMLDGAGASVLHAITDSGCTSDEEAIHKYWGTHPRNRHTREALKEALLLLAEANERVGPLDTKYQEQADALAEQYESALDALQTFQKHVSEQTSEEHISEQTSQEQVSEQIQALKAEMSAAKEVAKSKRHAWRKAMVHYLLSPSVKNKYVPVKRWTESEKQKLREARDKYGAEKAATMYGITTGRLRQLLPSSQDTTKGSPALHKCWF